jgi:hypothetical protein
LSSAEKERWGKNQRMNEQSNTVHIGFTNCSETGRGSA